MSTVTAPIVRNPNVLGQKPRSESEEKAAWVRRFNRWHRKALAAGAAADDLKAIYGGSPSKVQSESKPGLLFAAWHAKAVKVLGKSEVASIVKAGPRSASTVA